MGVKAASLEGVMEVFNLFSCVSGLKINAEKSSLFIGGTTSETFHHAATSFGLPTAQLPIHYLGLPLTTKSMNMADYEPLIDIIS